VNSSNILPVFRPGTPIFVAGLVFRSSSTGLSGSNASVDAKESSKSRRRNLQRWNKTRP
jgi:hypothetical protein